MKVTKIILLILIAIVFVILVRIIYIERYEQQNNIPIIYDIKLGTTAIVTTVRSPHYINDWIEYHLKIGFDKLYIVLDDETENIDYDDNRVVIIKNTKEWRNNLVSGGMLGMFSDKYDEEVMSRQILNFATVELLAKKEGINWLLHIDGDEIFYPENKQLSELFDNKYAVVKFNNYEMVPDHDSYKNCFREGTKFKTNGTKFIAYSNGKSALNLTSDAIITGVHGFSGGSLHDSPNGKILHYPSCNFSEYLLKYKMLGKFSDKWWGRVEIPIKFHTESRDIINSCKTSEKDCEEKIREFYNEKNVFNDNINEGDYKIINFVNENLSN
jgi:hypothetical protein